MAVSLKSDNLKAFFLGLAVSFGVTLGYFLLYHDSGIKKAVFGFFYFLVTPFLALPYFPMALLIMIIFFLLFRRVSSCMRVNLRWVAYALLWLHWVAFGLYCASYITL
jgi:hypothetical protein